MPAEGTSNRVTRKQFLKYAGSAGMLGLAGCTGGGGGGDGDGSTPTPRVERETVVKTKVVGQTEGDPIYLATVDDLSGPYSAGGIEGVRAVRLALEENDMAVAGRPIEFLTRDTELKPDKGVRKANQVIADVDPIAIISGNSSAVQLAMTKVAEENQTLFFTDGWATQITGSEGHRWVFRWAMPNWGIAQNSVAALLDEQPDISSVYTLSMDYSWGYDITEQANKVFDANNIEIRGEEYIPIGEADMSSYISNAQGADPDLVFVSQYGTNLINAVKQLAQFGVNQSRTILVPGDGLQILRGIGADALQNVYVGNHWWHTIDTAWTTEYREAFIDRFDLTPSFAGVVHYIEIKLLLEAIEEIGEPNTDDIIDWFEGREYDGPTGAERWREWDHQAIHQYYVGVGKAQSAMEYDDDFLDIFSSADRYPGKNDYDDLWSQ